MFYLDGSYLCSLNPTGGCVLLAVSLESQRKFKENNKNVQSLQMKAPGETEKMKNNTEEINES